MTTLYVTRGLPGSGKTHWAASWVSDDPARRARVERDELRAMLDDGHYIKGVTEHRVVTVRDAAILALLRRSIDVVCSDTNLSQRTVRDLAKLARQASAEFETVDFTYVPVDTCVERDARRDNPVGEAVIRDQFTRYLKGRKLPLPPPQEAVGDDDGPRLYEAKPGTPKTVLVDIDGTCALMAARSPFDETRVDEDRPNQPVIDVVQTMAAAGYRVVFLSGRTTGCRSATEAWLRAHVVPNFEALYMRPIGDSRKDALVKAELFDRHVRDVYDVTCVLDDRRQVVEMWRAMGLTVLQVAEGEF